MSSGGVPESEALELKITATVQFDFGSICDRIEAMRDSIEPLFDAIADLMRREIYPSDALLSELRDVLVEHHERQIKVLTRFARDKGNNAIRVIQNHLKHVKVTRRHNRDQINTERVIHTHEKGDSHGN